MPTPDTTALAAATMLYLTSGRIDWLHGRLVLSALDQSYTSMTWDRYVSVNWDLAELEAKFKDKIIAQGSLVAKLAIPT